MTIALRSLRGLWILWLISTTIKDVVGFCSKPTVSKNALIDPSDILWDKFEEKATIRLKCLPGYEPTSASPKSLTCEKGQWHPASGSFTCHKISCHIPGDLHNGRYEVLEGIEFGAVITATCNEGYNMVGDSTRTCQANGEWTGTEPICQVATCGLPPAIPSGQVLFKYGQELQYVCHPGFVLHGGSSASPDTVHCLGNGSWSTEPHCVAVRCNTPNIPHARRVEGGSGPYYGYKASVRYECNEGYRMVSGTSHMVCLENGWSSTPKCEADCATPLGLRSGLIADGKITASSALSHFGSTWYPHYARLDNWGRVNAWSPATNDRSQWLQVDLSSSKRVTGIITQGAKDYGAVQYVSAFKVAYSNDGSSWTVLKGATSHSDKVFQGNTDNDSHQKNLFSPPFYARYVRFLPWEWHERITLRMELLGCDK